MQIDGISKAPVASNLPQGDVYLGKLELDQPVVEKPWWAFIESPRFWVMLLGTVSIYLETKGWIGEAERNLIASIAAIFITVKTVDRVVDKMA